MLITTGRPKLWQTAKHAWASLFQALRQMAPLFLIGFLLMVGLNIAIERLTPVLAIPTRDALKTILTGGRSLPWLDVSKAMGLDFAVWILRAIIAAPMAVAIHRFILLGEVRRLYFPSRLSLTFARWVFVLEIPVIILSWLILFATGSTGLVPLLWLLMFALIVLLISTSQLLPGVAVEEASETFSGRIETALERAENMLWRTLLIFALAFAPVALVQAIAVRAFAKLAEHAPLLVPIGRAAAGFIAVTLSAALISWIYSYTAHRPRADRAIGAAPSPISVPPA
jgi:hypothetical protein